MTDLKRAAIERGLVASIGETTIWRWLSEDAIRPWRHRSWIFPRDPLFGQKAGRILDLYEGLWKGSALSDADCVLSADEKTSIQARRRKYRPTPCGPGKVMRIEHEYERKGALAYLAVWDVRQAKIFGHCEEKTGILPFRRLVSRVMSQEPYRSAPRVFWIMDNGSSHRGQACIGRLQGEWQNIVVVHTPVHASWLNQVEIYFSILQRKVLTPNDFASLEQLQVRIQEFEKYYEQAAQPFKWKFTRQDLDKLLRRIDAVRKAESKAA